MVAPLFFKGQIEFGVINQSSSAFNHILSDVSLVVYQVQLAIRSCAALVIHVFSWDELYSVARSLRRWQVSAQSLTGWESSQNWWIHTCRQMAIVVGRTWRRPR